MPYNYTTQNKGLMSVMNQGETFIHQSPVNDELSALIKLLISKINGCNYCVDLHKKELKDLGVTQMKIDEVMSYNHLDLFSEEERVTLEFAEKLNAIKDLKKFDIIERLKTFYDEEQITDLVFVVNQINSWNRLNIISENL
ncbi:carboxymuconolactone decarboxylase family protein [Staphylococcus schweitzeri]|uniref:Transposase n=1 Tax=Staphylococcus schweitzeri TaxID=1654388 RepID=A0A077UKU0_9STAP|nr:carboxymuconolactone decarboxylase family protein [Staphylococcus schweitzeri]CDR27648.1 transposase [Staphylococcus schweitzeri]